MNNEAKWKANQDKVAFLKQFPGLIQAWEEVQGQTVQTVIPLETSTTFAVMIFSNGQFAISHAPETEPKYLREGVETARTALEPVHPRAFAEYDVLANRDKSATRLARLENILGAIHNNVEQIPELKDRIRSLVKEWNS
ncbi:MAG: hypothetical protein O2999_15030 [Nitrospirae bacterium]|nr:hypothetical protein [Nitrospirota bacterium]MDA1305573.1 hypothetical protein [Nitrospirota bacterium]